MKARFVKSEDGERIYAVAPGGETIAAIEKDRFGTHGHWNGYKHLVPCPKRGGALLWVAIQPEFAINERSVREHQFWYEAPPHFQNVKEFKEYIENKGESK